MEAGSQSNLPSAADNLSAASGRNRRGAAAVEFAVVLPLFFLLAIGAIDVGRAIMVQHKLVQAARAGCRLYVVRDENTENDARAMIDTVMADADLEEYTVELDPATSDGIKQLQPVTVTVSIPHEQVSWLRTSWFLAGNTLQGTCIMPGDIGEIPEDDIADPPDDPPADPPADDDDDDDDDGGWRGWWRGWGGWW